MLYVKVASGSAPSVIRMLMDENVVDRFSKIRKDDGFRYIPILSEHHDEVTKRFDTVECERFERGSRSPQSRIMDRLSGLPYDILHDLPMRWEYIGDIAIIKGDVPVPFYEEIGEAYAKELGMKTICVDHGVTGEFRRPSIDVIYGNDTVSTRIENGIRYEMDVTKVMYSSGNTDERERMRHLDCSGETVVDMFAGIGYFTLPLAKFSHPRKVIACEKNPESFEFLVKNINSNGVGDMVEPVNKDNRDLDLKDVDRILMGYVQRTAEFLPKAISMLKDGGIIHYHDTFYVSEHEEKINDIFGKACGGFEILEIREVKSFAPSVSHYVADVKVTRTRRNPMR